jgi:hypothetical protein
MWSADLLSVHVKSLEDPVDPVLGRLATRSREALAHDGTLLLLVNRCGTVKKL